MKGFPYTDFHRLNDNWIITELKKIRQLIPTKTSQLVNDSGYITEAQTAPVRSVNGQTGEVVLSASDVGAKPASYSAPVDSVNGKTGEVMLSASDVGAKPASYSAPVDSVNGQTGAVVLDADDVGALPADPATAKQALNIASLNEVAGPFFVAGGTTEDLTVARNSRGLIIVEGVNTTLNSITMLYSNAQGSVFLYPMGGNPTNLTLSTSPGTLTVQNGTSSSGAYIYTIMFAGAIYQTGGNDNAV